MFTDMRLGLFIFASTYSVHLLSTINYLLFTLNHLLSTIYYLTPTWPHGHALLLHSIAIAFYCHCHKSVHKGLWGVHKGPQIISCWTANSGESSNRPQQRREQQQEQKWIARGTFLVVRVGKVPLAIQLVDAIEWFSPGAPFSSSELERCPWRFN